MADSGILAQNLLDNDLTALVGKKSNITALNRAKKGIVSRDILRETAQDFESFFLQTVLEDLTNDLGSDFLGGGGHAEQIWRSMLNEEFAGAISSSGGVVGIADSVYKELLALQEEKHNAERTKTESSESDTSEN